MACWPYAYVLSNVAVCICVQTHMCENTFNTHRCCGNFHLYSHLIALFNKIDRSLFDAMRCNAMHSPSSASSFGPIYYFNCQCCRHRHIFRHSLFLIRRVCVSCAIAAVFAFYIRLILLLFTLFRLIIFYRCPLQLTIFLVKAFLMRFFSLHIAHYMMKPNLILFSAIP